MVTDGPDAAAAPADDPGPAWPQFAVVNRSTLPDEIAARLLDLIRAESLRPGDKLPAERELAAMMHVSRPVLREALRALSIMNVVEIRQGAGTYITALEPQQLVSHLDFVFSKDPVALAQVIETRRVVEVGNVRLAAVRITPAQVARLEALLAELRGAVADADRFSTLDIAFHDAVCEAAGNFLLAQFMRDHQHAGQGQPGADRAPSRGHAGARARRPRGDRRRPPRRATRTPPRPRWRRTSTTSRRRSAGADRARATRHAVNIHGSHRFEAPREAVFAAIRDPRVLMAVIPGCEAVEEVAPDQYDGRITLRLPGAVGSYRTHVALVDVVEPERAGLDGRVEGSMGTITGRADFVLRGRRGDGDDRHGLPRVGRHRRPARPPRLPLRGAARRIADRPGPARPGRASRHGGLRVTVSHYYLPASVPEALGLLAEHGPELLVMAGGTVAMPLINEGISLPRRVMGLRRAGLDRIERVGDELRIGATATLTRLAEQDDVPLLRHGREPDGELVHPQHGHGRRQPVHPAARRGRRDGAAGAGRPRRGHGTGRAADRSRWPSSGPGFLTTGLGRRRAGHLDRGPGGRPAGRRSSSSGARRPTRRPSSRSRCTRRWTGRP